MIIYSYIQLFPFVSEHTHQQTTLIAQKEAPIRIYIHTTCLTLVNPLTEKILAWNLKIVPRKKNSDKAVRHYLPTLESLIWCQSRFVIG